jgi:hypothetical protein
MLFLLATVATFVLSGFAYSNGREKLAIWVSGLAILDLILVFFFHIGFVGLGIMGALGIVVAFAYRLDAGAR